MKVAERSGADETARRRLRGFQLHLLAYAVVAGGLAALNLAYDPERIWFVWPMVGWGGPLAIHAAYVMGLFGSRGRART